MASCSQHIASRQTLMNEKKWATLPKTNTFYLANKALDDYFNIDQTNVAACFGVVLKDIGC